MRCLCLLILFALSLLSCNKELKLQQDKIYSRHLQRHVELTIINTPPPKDKKELNLLICFNSAGLTTGKKIRHELDSLLERRLINPVLIVTVDMLPGEMLNNSGDAEGTLPARFNAFVANELYSFIKKKAAVRKFNSVAICGNKAAAINAYQIAAVNDEKMQTVGMLYPEFAAAPRETDMPDPATFRKRPHVRLWIAGDKDQATADFYTLMSARAHLIDCKIVEILPAVPGKDVFPITAFTQFLVYAFPKN